MAKTAVVLFNLGGPDKPESVQPFLFNLFNDPAILELPGPLRWLLAKLISSRRAAVAGAIYAEMGGGSPLLANTKAQAEALEANLKEAGVEARVFIAMRYWHPRASETAAEVKAYAPDRIVLLPLYPQFSASTTGSSLQDWHKAARAAGLTAPSRALCCYPTNRGFVTAVARKLRTALAEVEGEGTLRVLFSAHGLPKGKVDKGDPYQWQVERSVTAVMEMLGMHGLDYVVCYQSRVGPLKWLGPATDAEIKRCGHMKHTAVVVPIAFVSEHSETLVELDIEYKNLAADSGVPRYVRVPTVGTHPDFIEGLASLVRAALADANPLRPGLGEAPCPDEFRRCAQRTF